MSKKKILLLSDDIRMHSGIATMSREFVMGTLTEFDWVQIGGAVKHPEHGKIIDMNEAVRKESGIQDASLKIYPVSIKISSNKALVDKARRPSGILQLRLKPGPAGATSQKKYRPTL